MKTLAFTALFLSISLCCSMSFAKTSSYQPQPPFRINIAPQIARLKFQVNDFAIFRGVTGGGSLLFDYIKSFSFYGGAYAEWMMGAVDSRDQMSRYIHDVDGQARIGYTLPMWNFPLLTFTPYSGLGYEFIIQHIRPDLVLPSLKFEYSHYYIPVGMIINFNVLKYFNFGASGQWRPDISAKMRSPYIEGLAFSMQREPGYILELPMQFFISGKKAKAEISFIPYIKRVVDGLVSSSLPLGGTLTMPEQDYKYWGLRLVLGARF